jgi:dipeptidyl aminopeptidase/acylaminoacyl peptidase
MVRTAQNRFNTLTSACVWRECVQLLRQARAVRPVWRSVQLFVLLGTLLLTSEAYAQGRPDIVWMRGGHSSAVSSVAFSPDGAWLASGSWDGSVKLWRMSDGALVRTLSNLSAVSSIAFSPDGRLLVSGGGNGIIRIWRVSDGARVRTLRGHTDWVTSAAFSPDGAWLASGSWDRTIRLWRVSDGALLQTYDQETSTGAYSIQFSPNGQLFGYGRWDATVVVARNPFARRDGDVNGDGRVDDSDLLRVLFAFGNTGSSLPEDLNRDGIVDDADLAEVLSNFGSGC